MIETPKAAPTHFSTAKERNKFCVRGTKPNARHFQTNATPHPEMINPCESSTDINLRLAALIR